MKSTTTTALDALGAAIDEAIDLVEGAIGEPAESEDVIDARGTVAEVRDGYDRLLATLIEPERTEVQRAIGLKVAKLTGMLSRLES